MIIIFLNALILSSVNANPYNDWPSYRSSVMDGGRPILRMPKESAEETDSTTMDPLPKQQGLNDTKLAQDLGVLIAWLVEKLGHSLVQDVRRISDDPDEKGLRKGNDDPTWLSDLKVYMKDLVSHYGKASLGKYTKPIVESVEKKQNVIIKDIDVDQYGEVFVTYESKSNPKKSSSRISKIKKQVEKKQEDSSESASEEVNEYAREGTLESDQDSDQASVEHVTKMTRRLFNSINIK